jgi:type II secretory pathway component PulM
MARIALSTRDRRALLRGGLIVIAALVYSMGVRPSRVRRAQLLEQLEAERAVLARERAVVDGRRAAGSVPTDSATPTLFRGTDAVVASAELVEYLAGAAEQHDVWLQQAVTTPPSATAADIVNLEVTVRAESDLRGLLRWLTALERGSMRAHVQSLDVRASADSEDNGTSPLAISATVRSAAERQRGAP